VSATPLIVIFGAVVRPDGSPSAALLRRIGYGLEASRDWPDAPILCSGGACRPGRSEAAIMAEALLDAGVAQARLILDEASLTTADNVEAAAAQARAGGHPFVVACSDGYHLPRVRLLLALYGVRCRPWRGTDRAPLEHRVAMGLREGLAIPHSLVRAIARRRAS